MQASSSLKKMGDTFKLGSWKIPVQISVVKLYLGAVILDHRLN